MTRDLLRISFLLAIAAALVQPQPCRAQACGIWTYRSVTPYGSSVSGSWIVAGNGTTLIGPYVRHGDGPWLSVPGGGFGIVAWGAGRFVAVGDVIEVSDDGLSWRQVARSEGRLSDVAWNGSTFAAVGWIAPTGPAIAMTSPDGLRWTTAELPSDVSLQTIIGGGTQWVGLAGGWGAGVFTSPDAVHWTKQLSGTDFQGAGWDGRQYVVSGYDSNYHPLIATSSNGAQWTVRPSSFVGAGHFASNGTTWVVATGTSLLNSADGIAWNTIAAAAGLYPAAVIWTGSEFIAAGGYGIATSIDGNTWTSQPIVDLSVVVWAGDHFAAVGQEKVTGRGAAYISPDGLTWRAASRPPEGPAEALVWTGSQLVAVGPQGGVFTSPTGDAWTRRSVPAIAAAANLGSVAWSGSEFVVVAPELALTSTDGVTWTAMSYPGTFFSAVAWGAGKFVAVGGAFIFTSLDGKGWATEGPFTSGNGALFDIASSGTRFVAVGAAPYGVYPTMNSIVFTSTDGVNWSSIADLSPFGATTVGNVSWTGMGFAAVGHDKIFTSPDGLTWIQDSQFAGSVTAVAGNGRQLAAVGSLGAVAQMDCTAPPPIGVEGVTNSVLASAAHLPGLAGTQWVTDVELVNPGETGATALLYYLPRDTDNTISTRRAVAVPPGQAVRLADVVGQLFGLANSAGALVVSSTQPLVVTSGTSDTLPTGTLGQFVPGLPESAALQAGQEGRLIQLTENAAYRSNVGFASLSAAPTAVTITLFRSTGERLGVVPVTLPPFGSAQVTRILHGIGADPVEDGFAVVRSDTSGAKFVAYASVVDNVSGDPLTVLPVTVSTSEPLYVPAVAHNPGLNGTMWRTDLEVATPGTVQAAYRIELLESGQDNSTPPAATFTLDPGTSRRYPDVVGEVFGFTGSGAIRVTPLSGTVAATARTYTDTGTGSRGQFTPALPLSQATAAGSQARLVQLTHSANGAAGFRTNVGFVNAGAAPIAITAALYTAGGTWLGSRVDTLMPYEFIQDTAIFGKVTTADVADGFAVVTSGTTDAKFFAYASVTDNRSGAPVYVPAQ